MVTIQLDFIKHLCSPVVPLELPLEQNRGCTVLQMCYYNINCARPVLQRELVLYCKKFILCIPCHKHSHFTCLNNCPITALYQNSDPTKYYIMIICQTSVTSSFVFLDIFEFDSTFANIMQNIHFQHILTNIYIILISIFHKQFQTCYTGLRFHFHNCQL